MANKIELPKKRTGIDDRYCSAKIGVLGMSGVGKTGTICGDPDVLIIDSEGGSLFYDNYTMQARSIADLQVIVSKLNDMHAAGEFIYSSVFLDTIDNVINFANKEAVRIAKTKERDEDKKALITDVGNIPREIFNGYNFSRGMVMALLNALEQLPCATGYIGHILDKHIKENDGKEFDVKTISVGAKMGADLLSWADHVIFIDAKKQGNEIKRTIRTKPSQSIDAKSRGGLIKDGIAINGTDVENWNEIRKHFN